jgi:hypothetical protein
LERPAPPNTWVGEPWSPGRVVLAVLWVLGKAFLWSILWANVGMLVAYIFLGGSEAMVATGMFLGIGVSIVIAAYEPVKSIREEIEHRHRVAEGKDAYARAVKAFDDRESERAAIRAKFEDPTTSPREG